MRVTPLLIVVLAVSMIVVPTFAAASGITATHLGGTEYQFSVPAAGGVADSMRWAFGDGATSTELQPVHEFAEGVFNVTAEDEAGNVWTLELDTRTEIPAPDPTVDVAGFSVHGGMLMFGSGLMFLLAYTGQHPASDLLGRNGRGVVMLAYSAAFLFGAVLVWESIYPGAVA